MSGKKESPAIAADKKRMQWVQHQWRMLQEEEKFDKVTGEIIEKFLNTLILANVKRPDIYTLWSGSIRRAIEEEVGLPLTSHAQLVIKRWASANARVVAGKQLYEPTQAVAISKSKIDELVSHLWFKRWNNLSFRQSAVIAYICANTGARANEVIQVFIEDFEWHEDGETSFLRLPLRSSKGNAFKARREALVLPTTTTTRAALQHWLKVIMKGRKKGKLFQNTNTAKLRDHFRAAGRALGWIESPSAHSLRAHYVVESLRAGASESDIVAVCRWKDDAMLNTYRMRQVECTEQGPAFKILKQKLSAGKAPMIPLEPVKKVAATVHKQETPEVIVIDDKHDAVEPAKRPEKAVQPPSVAPNTTPTLSPQAYDAWDLYFASRSSNRRTRKNC